jgi:hypothetical protein
MRVCFAIFLMAVMSAACAGDEKKDVYLDAVAPPADAKAMEGRVDPVVRKAIADALAAEVPPQSLPQSAPALSTVKSDIMTAAFIEAKVPDCLHSEGLKRQPTFIFTGYLALPFIPIAKLRGKCI